YCYIIYSQNINKYFIDETENFERRIAEHNSGVFKCSFTKQTILFQ
ncbi:MAG: GIY-YIG nuclease family protein, partial [Bacteroidales bacterium]|nr:GIY-YIG nuclease family protein [Bacteroidales bacterium]